MSRPFDEARYRGLLEGLEAVEICFSQVMAGTQTNRFDPEYFNRTALLAQQRLADSPTLGELVRDGYRVVYESTNAIDREVGIRAGLPFFLQSSDISTPFIDAEAMVCVSEDDWIRYPKGRIRAGELLIEVKGKAEKIAIVPDDFPDKTLVTGTCFKLTTKEADDRYVLTAYLTCKYGQALKERLKTNLLVSYLAKDDLYSLPVPRISVELREAIKSVFQQCFSLHTHSRSLLVEAEQTLLRAVGLKNWQPPEPLTYTRPSRDAFAAGRLDAEYFAPRVVELLNRLNKDGLTISAVAPARHERFIPGTTDSFDYIEIGGVRADGTAVSESVPHTEAPSRATWLVKSGDVVTSTVRPIRRLSALIAPEQDGHVCSSGFVVLQSTTIPPEVLLTYLRLPPVCELLDLHTSASLYPAISEVDLLGMPIPHIGTTTQTQIVESVRAAQASHRRAAELLEAAKRAVEIAIESGEASALEFLNKEMTPQ